MAQSREDDARFETAQQRLDSELAIFKTEFERYQRAKSSEPQVGGPGPRYEDPRVYGDDSRRPGEYPGTTEEGHERYPDDRGDGRYEPRQ